MEKKRNQKGFTLAELLIVVAIIAVLVAIAIPIFTAQLEKSREATDLANVRSAYAEQVSKYLTTDDGEDIPDIQVPVKQKVDKWQSQGDADNAIISEGKKSGSGTTGISVPAKTSGTYDVHCDSSTGAVTVD